MFGPLSFPASNQEVNDLQFHEEITKPTVCILCEEKFILSREKIIFLKHLFRSHNLVIQDVKKIAYLDKYVEYWKMRLKDHTLDEIGVKTIKQKDLISTVDAFLLSDACSSIGVNTTIETTTYRENIFVLSDDLLEDKKLRNNLKTERLEFVLEQQKREREMTTYCRECLFCRTEISGSTTDYLDHLSGKHNLLLGRPQNLVFIDQLINTIEDKLVKLICLYCEKHFKDRNALKEHMRKKQHKRINPKNTEYDRYYIVNYLEVGKSWKSLERCKENESPDSDCSDSDWSDWREEVHLQIVCLFCKTNCVTWEDTLSHMKSEHNFDYKVETVNMDFYQQIKLVNYIRRQIHRLSCISCDVTPSSDNIDDLLLHIQVEHNFSLPDQSLWDQPEYFFPTYENDLFLCHIDDEPCDSETATSSSSSSKEAES